MADIEKNLREIAKAKGLKLSDIAARMGTTVSNLLTSVKGNPTVSKIQDIAEALGVGVSDLLTLRPESAQGLVVIDGKTWQIARPSDAVVQIPTYNRYDVLRGDVRVFIARAVEGKDTVSMSGIVETMELFCLLYDGYNGVFHLSLCYGGGKTMTLSYDRLEFCDASKDVDGGVWDVGQVTEEIINDLEGAVPAMLRKG
ncbi:MAG: helix-turn-helix transcriptional regulator [Bacteroidales bacterium]|nr:helix-turn-helix transcriptional regulator [Bacteroidales bacterium]